MIYKFIDDHGTEITVNSLSQLQTLVEGQTIKKNTKVKVGLRGKWGRAKDVNELKFEEEKKTEPEKKTEDMVSFVTREAEPTPKKEEIKKQPEKAQAENKNVVSAEIEREITSIDYKDQKATDKSEEISKTDKQTSNLGSGENQNIVLFFKKLWQGKYSLKLSFWVLYFLPNLLFSILFLFLLTHVLKAEASLVSILLFYAATFAVIGYLSISMVGTWKSANYFRILVGNKASKLGIVAQIFVSADILLRIIGVTKQFI
jgi:hypothetical protein